MPAACSVERSPGPPERLSSAPPCPASPTSRSAPNSSSSGSPSSRRVFDYDRKNARFDELNALQAQPDFWGDQGKAQKVVAEMKGKSKVHAGVIHASSPAEAQEIAAKVRSEVNPAELLINELTPVIGANVGPGVIGMGYYTE